MTRSDQRTTLHGLPRRTPLRRTVVTRAALVVATGVVLAAWAPSYGILGGLAVAVGAGLVVGVVNGALVTVGGVNNVAATFATMALARGLAYLIPSGLAIVLLGFRALGNTEPLWGIALPTFMFGAFSSSMAQAERGRLKVLGVSSRKRMAMAPDVPTIAETLPGFEVVSWYGVLGPAGMPPAIASRPHGGKDAHD